MRLIFLIFFTTFCLTGCFQSDNKNLLIVRDKSDDYLTSIVKPPLQVPADLSPLPQITQYPLPDDLPQPGTVAKVDILPPGFGERLAKPKL